jgi:hypothetical protein
MVYKPKIFLSGGFRSNWQEKVVSECDRKGLFFNPREHGLEKSDLYTTWDIHYVRDCDIFFGYMESTNPSGYGLAFELGLAHALNKTIILVDERSTKDEVFAKYFKILYKPSGVVLDNLADGITYLKSFLIKS